MTIFTAQPRREHQVGYPRFRSSNKGISFVVYFFLHSFGVLFPSNYGFASRLFSADKRYVAPNLIFINILDLNRVLKSEVFVSEDRQLRAVHLILDFIPLSDKFQDVGNAIRANDPRLAQIDIS